MEIGNTEQQPTVKIKVSELIKKFKHREDRYNFCRQQGKPYIVSNFKFYIRILVP